MVEGENEDDMSALSRELVEGGVADVDGDAVVNVDGEEESMLDEGDGVAVDTGGDDDGAGDGMSPRWFFLLGEGDVHCCIELELGVM
jgi:hypothetical protein